MPHALPLDDDTYEIIAAYAKEKRCSLAAAVRMLMAKTGAPSAAAAPPGSHSGYRLPSRSLSAREGLNLTRLAHADEDE